MKKIIALLLCALMLIGLSACGKEKDDLGSALGDALNEAAGKTAGDTKTPSDGPEEPVETEEPVVEDTRALAETDFISLRYHEEDGWVIAADDDISSGDKKCTIKLSILNSEDKAIYYVWANAVKETVKSYRDKLHDEGFDLYELAVNHAYPTVNIGGLEFYHMDGAPNYYCRDEGAGVTVKIVCYANYDHSLEDEVITRLLEGFCFTQTDVGNADFPWPWEGTPFSGTTLSSMAGTASVTAEWLPLNPCLTTFEIFDHDVAVSGNTVYILSGNTLRSYEYDGAALNLVEETVLEKEYTGVDVLADGTVTLSGFMRDYAGFRNGEQVFSYSGPDYFAPAPDGTWGISYFTSNTVKLFRFDNGAVSSEELVLTDLRDLMDVRVDGSYVYVCGRSAETDNHTVFVYDHNLNLQYALTGKDGKLGSVTYATKTPNGFLALDGNMRDVVLWNSDGAYIGDIDDADLFGTGYPWFCTADYMPDGSLLVVMTDERPDHSSLEVLAFALTGY